MGKRRLTHAPHNSHLNAIKKAKMDTASVRKHMLKKERHKARVQMNLQATGSDGQVRGVHFRASITTAAMCAHKLEHACTTWSAPTWSTHNLEHLL